MKKTLLPLGMSLLMAASAPVQASAFQKADIGTFRQQLTERINANQNKWHHKGLINTNQAPQRVVSQADAVLPPASFWGSLNTPDGQEWMYTMDYSYETVGEYMQSISSAVITIYDANFKVYRTFTANFELGENETTINSVQVSPNLTKKFFNTNDAYEVMVYVHATTPDYTGHVYTQVYTLSDCSMIAQLEGDNIGAINMATDSWSEKFTLVFMRDEYVMGDDEEDYTDDSYLLHFDVYSRAGWGTGCVLEHTFDIDYKYIAGAGNYALPLLMNTSNNRLYYALPRYEKEYFESSYSEEVTPDNHFIIDLYDDAFNLIKTTTIPMELEDGALFSFPGLGELMGNGDMSFDFFGQQSKYPFYIIGMENYIASTDDFKTSLYVYDSDGNRLLTIADNADDYLRMTPITGQQEQYCFYYSADDGGYFDFVDIPSCNVVATIPLPLDGQTISTSIDRVTWADSYKYASSMLMGDSDAAGNVFHKIAWYNSDGTFDRIDRINLGKDVIMAQVNIQGEALTPYVFNTDEHLEYMFLTKEVDPVTNKSKEYFRIYNDQSDMLLDFGPDEATGEYLSSIFLTQAAKAPKLVIAYYANDQYRLHTIDLPLNKFAGGEGTESNPYQIATVGDLMAMQSAPGAHYQLVGDIDSHKTPWAGNDCEFTGTFDGQGHTISNLNIYGPGIFKSIGMKGKVQNLNLKDVRVDAHNTGGIIAGSIIGEEKSDFSISNVHINGAFASSDEDVLFGGIVGELMIFSKIEDCSVTDARFDLGDNSTVGGIVGSMSTSSQVSNTLFDGWIIADIAGGIAGRSQTGDESISNCHAHVDLVARNIAGGIIGESSRTAVDHCFVDGSVNAVGKKEAYSGGISGYLRPTYDAVSYMAISNCIVAADIKVNEEAKSPVTHRIAGFTSGDELLVDWESNDPSVDWTNPATYPYINGEPETALNNNYYVGASIEGESVSNPDGESISKDALTDDFLSTHEWSMGTIWKLDGAALALKDENFDVEADHESIAISNNDQNVQYVTFTMPSRYAHLLDINTSDPKVAEVGDCILSADGHSVTCQVLYVGDGECTLTAALGDHKATCTVIAKSTSMAADVIKSTLGYDGKNVVSEGRQINVYDTTGRVIATGLDSVAVSRLAKGVYIVTDGQSTIKISL